MGNITQYISEGLLQASQVAEHKLVYSPEGQEGIHISPQWHPIWLSALSGILYGYQPSVAFYMVISPQQHPIWL